MMDALDEPGPYIRFPWTPAQPSRGLQQLQLSQNFQWSMRNGVLGALGTMVVSGPLVRFLACA